MGLVNRFLLYANPLLWAALLRKKKRGPERVPYSFTVKINDYITGEEKGYDNTIQCNLAIEGEEEQKLIGVGSKVMSGVYDASKSKSKLTVEIKSDQNNYQGYSLSPLSKWKLTTKDGESYEGIIGNSGVLTILGLFTITRTKEEDSEGTLLYFKEFLLESVYDCVILDGCTLEFSPIFEEIQHVVLTATSQYSGTHSGLAGYESELWFYNKESEKAKTINEWIVEPGTGGSSEEFVYIKNNEYMKLKVLEYEEDGETKQYGATVKYTNSEGTETTVKVMPITDNNNNYLIKLNFNGETKGGYVNISPKDKTIVYVESLYEEDNETFATITANVHTESQGKGLVQVNSGVIGNTSTVYLLAGDNASFKATPISGATFDGWYVSGGTEPVSTANPYNVTVTEEMYGETGYSLYAKFSEPEITCTIRKKNYYDASITLEKRTSTTSEPWETLCENYYDWSSALPSPYGATLHKGDVLRITMTYDTNGFENPKLRIGNTVVDYTGPYTFMLDETTCDIQYELELKDDYGAVFAEVYPDKYKGGNFDVTVYILEKTDEINDRYKAAEIPFNMWTEIIREENFWQTHAVDLSGDKEYFVGLKVSPAVDPESGVEEEPYLSHWREAVESQIWGGAYKCVYNRTLNKDSRYRLVRLSCYVYSEEEKNAKNGIFTIDTDKDTVEGFEAKSLVTMFDAQTLLSMYEKNPKCVFDKTSDNVVITRKVQDEVMVGTDKYVIDKTQLSATSQPEGLVKQIMIDPSGHIRTIFNDSMKTAANPVVTLHLKYNQQTTDELEPLKIESDEVKVKLEEKLMDEVDVAETVIAEEEKPEEPVKDEIVSEPIEDNE